MKWISLFFLPALLSAQFQSLAVTGDGSQLYFSSRCRLKGTDLPFHGKVFRIGEGSPELWTHRSMAPPAPVAPVSPGLVPIVANYGNYYDLIEAGVTRDGSITWYVARRDCAGRACDSSQRKNFETTVMGLPGKPELHLSGPARLSGNGRYALLYDAAWGSSLRPELVDLLTGEARDFAGVGATRVTPLVGAVADNGTAVVTAEGAIMLLHHARGEAVALPRELSRPEGVVIDPGGSTILYRTVGEAPETSSLRIRSLASGASAVLVRAPGLLYNYGFTAGARQVYFLSNAQFGTREPPGLSQLYIINVDGTGFRQLSQAPFGVKEAAVSGDGSTAGYTSNDGRIVHVDIRSGVQQERVGRTPLVSGSPSAIAPGSIVSILGTALAADTSDPQPPLPRELPGISITLDAHPVSLAHVSPSEVLFQAPWELQTATGSRVDLVATFASGSVFEAPPLTAKVGVADQSPQFIYIRERAMSRAINGFVLAAHEDWEELVTTERPAKRGEVVHVYATGFGAVDQAPPTGEAAPTDRLVPSLTSPICFMDTDRQAIRAPVIFSGLAPGTVGYYLISIQVPLDVSPGTTQLGCNGAFGYLTVER